ncbi:MAG TPA: type II CRISPR RNA-guided endonuclease Cas9 [Bryobacteraceae bacterium]|nr:type II CRISPR RNA-guided endonuclease Cas9 [Bryobacteraceae bacterium]HPU73373.1 type II CRISPR RNA-guided endonuclease Cas9 [Bryobacteraceae bacterium]
MSRANSYILGIDLGVNSLGAALIDKSNREIVWTGVRIFTPGFEGDYASGNEESRARQRRLARQQRRQTDRRRRRLLNVFRILQQYGLLPCGDREKILPAIDAELALKYPETEVLPYYLRARSLDHKLTLYEIGRALYHLAQRRGFRGRAALDQSENSSEFKKSIEGLWKEIHASGSRTLGEYFSKLNPHETRIRGQRTHRRMYEEEFAAIWTAQQQHYPDVLTDARRQVLERAIFYQRPLKPSDDLVGDCELEPGEKRAPLWTIEAQRFRVLNAINNLMVVQKGVAPRKLEDHERQTLIEATRTKEKISFPQVRKLLSLPASSRFSIEEDGDTNLPGDIVSSRMFAALGSSWLEMPEERQRELVADLGDARRNETDEDLFRCLTEKWGYSPDVAQRLCEVALPSGYSRLSSKAICKALPFMEQGMTFGEARRKLWPEQFEEKEPLDYLPPVLEAPGLKDIRNPAVIRALSELRKTVNAVIRRFGKPASIHIELARDMKRSREERRKEARRNQQRRKLREEAREALRPYLGDNVPSRQIEKYLLWLECGRHCPYSGQPISLEALFGDHPRFDVEHIIPFDRCLDDSFQNKTLCEAGFNRLKGNRTPWEAFGHTEEWPLMVERVRAFRNVAKLRRFIMTETDAEKLLGEFVSRQLCDTRYASRLAAKYLGLLFGIDRPDNNRIIVCAGAVTAFLRQKWDLNRILNEKPEKNRDDYRHHAVDAIAVALATQAQIQQLADAARRARAEGHRRFGSLPDPWPGFREQARNAVLRCVVSHRPKRRLKGALHNETYYSAPEQREGKMVVRCRKPVTSLTKTDIEAIVDERIREIVRAAWEAVGSDAKKFEGNWPFIESNGRKIPIKRVRCFQVETVRSIAEDRPERRRHVIPGGNHHIEIWAETDPKSGLPKRWHFRAVSRLEAMERYRRRHEGVRIVQRDHGPNTQFCFSLSEGDMVAVRRAPDQPETLWCVRSARTRGSFELQPATDARLKKDAEIWDVALNTLMKLGCRKVVVTPLGDIVDAHD